MWQHGHLRYLAIAVAGAIAGSGITLAAVATWPRTYEDCVLDHVGPGVSNFSAAQAIHACRSKFPVKLTPVDYDPFASGRPAKIDPSTVQWDQFKPIDVNDDKGWNAYLGQLVQANLQGMKAPQPYAYLVTPGRTDDQQAQNARQLQDVQDTVARGMLPGNLLAFGGPSSAATSEFVIDAFKNATPGSFKGVIVVFIGDKADEQRVADATKPTGATFRFITM